MRQICLALLVSSVALLPRPAHSEWHPTDPFWFAMAQAGIQVCDFDIWTAAAQNYAAVHGIKPDQFGGLNMPPDFPKYPQPCNPVAAATPKVEMNVALGGANTRTNFRNERDFSAGVGDPVSSNDSNPSGGSFVGGIGVSVPDVMGDPSAAARERARQEQEAAKERARERRERRGTRHSASEAANAYAAYFPRGASSPPAPRLAFGLDANVYFFAGGDQRINGIPGGPFGTPTGADNFTIRNNYLFTVGGALNYITPSVIAGITGGFAELNQTVTYNCVTFCNLAPPASQFSASQDKWVSGGYVGGRVQVPFAIPGLPGAKIGVDYKHIFFGHYDVSLGNVSTRQVNARLSPDMDIVTATLSIPLR